MRPVGLAWERLASHDAEHAGHAWLRLQDGSAVEHAGHAQEHVRPAGLAWDQRLASDAEHAGHAWERLAHAQQEHARPRSGHAGLHGPDAEHAGLAWERLASDVEPAGHAWLRLQDGSAAETVAHAQEHVKPSGLRGRGLHLTQSMLAMRG